jgi:hypothetical protein
MNGSVMIIKKAGIFILAGCVLLGISRVGVTAERVVTYNGTKIHYDDEADYLRPRCALLPRHQSADSKSRYAMVSDDVCRKYQTTRDENYSFPGAQGQASVILHRKDFFTLDEISLWKGKPPFGLDLISALQLTIPTQTLTRPICPIPDEQDQCLYADRRSRL